MKTALVLNCFSTILLIPNNISVLCCPVMCLYIVMYATIPAFKGGFDEQIYRYYIFFFCFILLGVPIKTMELLHVKINLGRITFTFMFSLLILHHWE